MKGTRSYFKKASNYTQKYATQSFILAGVLMVTLLLIYDFNKGMKIRSLLENITASVIEVFFLGLFVVGYNEFSKRKKDIERFQDEITSYMPWWESEATYRIVGLIRSLNKLRVTNINISQCFLLGADLSEANFSGANLWNTNLGGADLSHAKLVGANLTDAKLEGAILWGANLEGADLTNTKLEYAILTEANLSNAILSRANLTGTDLSDVNFEGLSVDSENWMEKLKGWNCNGVEDIEKKYYVQTSTENNKIVYRIRKKAN